MQEMDELLEANAHGHPGWCGHAEFLQSEENNSELLVVYPWRSKDLHADLLSSEERLLKDFVKKYCSAPRKIRYFFELPVEVD